MAPYAAATPAAYAAATPAPVPQATAASSWTYTFSAPLTTTFTPPAACFTNLPTIIAGTCSNPSSCSAWNAYDFSQFALARQNIVYWTTSAQLAGATSCYPPGFGPVNGFYYSPAVGCPVGYGTLTWYSLYSDYDVVCCPAGFSHVRYASSYSNYWCEKPMTRGDAGVLVAVGGTTLSSNNYYYEFWSTIGTTTLSSFPAYMSSLLLQARGLELYVPATMSTGTPKITALSTYNPKATSSGPVTVTSTGNSTGPAGLWSTYDGKPHLFHQTFPITMLILVCFALVSVALAKCCWSGCCGGKPRPVPVPVPPQPVRRPPIIYPEFDESSRVPQPPPPYIPGPPRPIPPPRPVSPPSPVSPVPAPAPWTPLCTHKNAAFCSTARTRRCCKCEDVRSFPMDRYSRIGTYCVGCKSHWGVAAMPNGWDKPACDHKGACSSSPLKRCCGCEDTRRRRMPRSQRVASYCVACRRRWLGASDAPSWWGPILGYCEHKKATLCTLPPEEENCCTCKDQKARPQSMSKDERIKAYCGECLMYWRRRPLADLPKWWKCEDLDKSKYSYIRHAKLEVIDGTVTGDFIWFAKKRVRETKYTPPVDLRGQHDGVKDWGPRSGPPEFFVSKGLQKRKPTFRMTERLRQEKAEREAEEHEQVRLNLRKRTLRWWTDDGNVAQKAKEDVLKSAACTYTEKEAAVEGERDDTPPPSVKTGNMMDLGPTYASPRFGVPVGAAGLSVSSEKTHITLKEVTVEAEEASSEDRLGAMMDFGPKLGAPRFDVPADVEKRQISSGQEVIRKDGSRPSSRASFVPERRESRPWDRHVQRSAPKFQVGVGGTIDA